MKMTSTVVTVRGERLALLRTRYSGRDKRPGGYFIDALVAIELDADERILALLVFDSDDIDAAIAELDARYVAGEAAAYSQTWSAIAASFAAVNKHELPQVTPDWVSVDRRRLVTSAIEPGDLTAYVNAGWNLTPEFRIDIESVHRLTNRGAVVTHKAQGISQAGFGAEWKTIDVLTLEGGLVNRCELFDETELDAALARFDELSRATRRPENAASRVAERFCECFGARDWIGMGDTLADDVCTVDNRPVVGVGSRRGRDLNVADWQAVADVGTRNLASTVIATRGAHLALSRFVTSGRDQRPEAFRTEVLCVIETNADNRIVACVMFEADKIDAAFEELEARYLAGEAARYAGVWSIFTDNYAMFNRHEIPPLSNWATTDHRVRETFAGEDLAAYLHSGWDVTPDNKMYVECVHRLSDLGAVVTHVAYGTSPEGFYAEWRIIALMTLGGTSTNRCELFDEADLETALAIFDELSRPVPRLENTATRMFDHLLEHHAARDYDASAEMLAEDYWVDDRRRVVNAGIRHGRDAAIADARAVTELGGTHITSDVIATRGERLFLTRSGVFIRDEGPEVFDNQSFVIVEIGADERAVSMVVFDLDDIDAAFAELDARYVAREAAPYAATWSVVAEAFAAANRREPPSTTSDWVNLDHRRMVAFAPGEMTEYLRATWEDAPEFRVYIESVHQLSSLGALVTHVWHNTSLEGFDAEWRVIGITTVECGLINRCELFDETDLDAALARFDELRLHARQLENSASQLVARVWASFAARDWVAITDMIADDFSSHDHRRVVNAGVRHGRDVHVENMRAVAEVGFESLVSRVIATRGQRLALCSTSAVRGLPYDEVSAESIMVVEIDADDRLVVNEVFDLDDIDAAFAELDARYLAGEAAAYARTWSVVTGMHEALNRHEPPLQAANCVRIDHRRPATFEMGDLAAFCRATWALTPEATVYVEAVHRLTDLGAVFTQVTHGSSQEGFDVEWRMVDVLTVDGDLANRGEIFDETDLDAALARFDELNASTPRLENTATRGNAQIADAFNRRDLERYFTTFDANARWEDRRKGLRNEVPMGSKLARSVFLGAPPSWRMEIEPVAIRGPHLALSQYLIRDTDEPERPITIEVLLVTEVNNDGLFCRSVTFDPDDIDSAFMELDARYLAGEAAARAHTWSLVLRTYAAFNQHELSPTTRDCVNIDHRPGIGSAPGDMHAYVSQAWEVASDITTRIDAVYRLSNIGAVFSHAETGTSEGFTAEWREVTLLTFEGGAISRCEIFDETDLETALAKFDELNRPTPRLENAAIRARMYVVQAYNRRDVKTFLGVPAGRYEDRRKGLGDEGAMDWNYAHAVLSETPTCWRLEMESVAIRGDRLALSRETFRDTDDASRPITIELITLTEVDQDEMIRYTVFFDTDDLDAAFEELEARYLAGEAAAHAHTWSVIREAYAAFNRRELPAATPAWVDHRLLATIQPGDLIANVHAAWDLVPDVRVHMAAEHRLNELGAVVDLVVKGNSQEGFYAEYHEIAVVTVDGDLPNRFEMFDEADLDAALARFDELSRSVHSIENAAMRTWARLVDAYNRRNLDAFVALTAPDGQYHDRRKGLRDTRDGSMRWRVAQTLFDLPPSLRLETEPLAIRGSRLCLLRQAFRDTDDAERPIVIELVTVLETTEDGMAHTIVNFDTDDIDSAMAELTARCSALNRQRSSLTRRSASRRT